MRKTLLLFFLLQLGFVSGQTEGINFQSILFDSNGQVQRNATFDLEFSLDNASGTTVYSEQQSLTTDSNGVVTAIIGTGTVTVGTSFSQIDWTQVESLEVFKRISGSFVSQGTSSITYVPFSYTAQRVYSSGIDISSGIVSATGVTISGVVTATRFVGDGSGLTNLAAGSIDGLNIETSGNLNVAIGKDSFGSNSSGVSNVAIGERAMSVSNTTGSWNTAVGAATMINNTTGSENTAIGSGALESNLTGDYNAALGHRTLNVNSTGVYNTAVGWTALSSSVSSSANTAIGSTALKNITNGQMNVAVGSGAIEDATAGNYNIAVGGDALHKNSVGSNNVAIGSSALFSNTGSGTYDAGDGISWDNATSNIAIGSNALYHNTTGSFNTAIGVASMYNSISTINNVAVGIDALQENISGWDNTALGAYALKHNTSSQEVAVGSHALQNNTSGNENTAIGSWSLYQSVLERQNTALGYYSGYNNIAGSNANTFIGYKSDTVSGTTISNATAIGANAIVTTSNTVVLGDDNVTNWAFGLQTTDSGKALQVGDDSSNGNGAYLTTGGTWTNASSIKLKTNFLTFTDGWFFEKIKQLNILKWDYINTNETHIGPTSEQFIEQFGVGDGADKQHLSTLDVSGVALRGVQGLINRDESQEEEIKVLKSEIEELKSQIETLKSLIQSKK